MLEIEVTNATDLSAHQELSFGNVYSGLIVAKSLWIHNTSEENSVSVTLTASRWPFQGLDEDIDDFGDVTFESISSGHMGSSTENARNVDGEVMQQSGTSTRGNNYDNNTNIIKRSKSSFLQKKYGPPNNPFLSYIAAKNPRAAVRKLTSTMNDLKKRGYNLDALIDVNDEESAILGLDVPTATTTAEMATELLPRGDGGNNDDGSIAVNSTDLSTATIAAIDNDILVPTSVPDSLSLGTAEAYYLQESKYASYDPRYTRHRKDTGFRLTAEAVVGSSRRGLSSSTRRQPQSDDWRNDRSGGGRDSYGTTSYSEDAYDYGDDDDDEYTMDMMGNKHSTPHNHHRRKHCHQLVDEPLSDSRCMSRSDSPLSDQQPHHQSTRRSEHRHQHKLDSINTFVEMELTGDVYDSNRSYRLIHRNHRRNSHMPLLSPDDMDDDDDYDMDNDDTLPYHPITNGDIDDQGQGLGESKNLVLTHDVKLRGQPSLRISTHTHTHLAHHTTQSVTLQQQGTTTNKKHGSGGATLSWVVQLSSVMFDDYSKNYHFTQHWQRGGDEGYGPEGNSISRYGRQQQQPQSPVSRQFMHSRYVCV